MRANPFVLLNDITGGTVFGAFSLQETAHAIFGFERVQNTLAICLSIFGLIASSRVQNSAAPPDVRANPRINDGLTLINLINTKTNKQTQQKKMEKTNKQKTKQNNNKNKNKNKNKNALHDQFQLGKEESLD